MPRLQITVSDALFIEVQDIAERDAPGAPNLSATGLRLLALGVAVEREREAARPVERPRLDPPQHAGEAGEAKMVVQDPLALFHRPVPSPLTAEEIEVGRKLCGLSRLCGPKANPNDCWTCGQRYLVRSIKLDKGTYGCVQNHRWPIAPGSDHWEHVPPSARWIR